jgi:hypothetical protein
MYDNTEITMNLVILFDSLIILDRTNKENYDGIGM